MTGSQRLDTILMFMGALVPLMSALASFINHLVRQKTDAGEQVSSALLNTGAFLNVASVNVDKAVQLAKMAKGQSVAVTTKVEPPTQSNTQPPPSTYVA